MPLTAVIPSLYVADVGATVRSLPGRLMWPASVGFEDATTTEETRSMGARLIVDGAVWTVHDDRSDSFGACFRDDPTVSRVSAVDVAWTIEYDVRGGEIWAIPAFSGIRVTSDSPGTLADLCAAVGFKRRLVRRIREIPLHELAPYLVKEVAPLIAALPSRVPWPVSSTVRVDDYSDSGLGYYAGAVIADGKTWTLGQDGPNGRSPVDPLNATWEILVDQPSGDVWALPTFTGAQVESGPGSFKDLLRAVGLRARKLATLGMLTQFCDPDNDGMADVAEKLGIVPAVFRFVRVSDLGALRDAMVAATRL